MGNKSTVTSASITSNSLRTTIPKGICKTLNLASGDVLDWSVENKANKKFIVVRKLA